MKKVSLKHCKKTGLKYFNIEDIRSWKPCYDPSKHLLETFRGTATDILKNESIPVPDRLWIVLRNEIVSDKLMRLFAVWCYRQTLTIIPNQDARSIQAANVAEQFALGKASADELKSAYLAADSAAYSAADSAARSAVRSAAYSAADSAARSAAYSAAYSALSAAYSALSAADSAARSAADSVRSSYSVQRDKLIEMIVAEGKERVRK